MKFKIERTHNAIGVRPSAGPETFASRTASEHSGAFSHFTVSAPGDGRTPGERAFTLAEVLAAMVFMAILIPVALEGLSIASRAGEVAARKSEAALVAEKILNETVATTNWNSSGQSGTVRQGVRDFRWKLNNESWNQDSYLTGMRLLSVEVSFDAQGREYKFKMSTLVDGSPPTLQTTNGS